MRRTVSIPTDYGLLYGRDGIFVTQMERADTGRITISGAIEVWSFEDPGSVLDSDVRLVPFSAVCIDARGFQIVDRITWRSRNRDHRAFSGSCFEEVLDSPWLRGLGTSLSTDHRHFRLATDDSVLEVVCTAFAWIFSRLPA
jgi:hypothetical protein